MGHEALYTKQSDIGITTDAYNYGITADASIEINTSIDTAVTKTFIDSNSFGNLNRDFKKTLELIYSYYYKTTA